jgi:hypothetical protein
MGQQERGGRHARRLRADEWATLAAAVLVGAGIVGGVLDLLGVIG